MNRKLKQIQIEELRMTEPRKAHPEEETLELYALGRLDEPELGEVEEHILICAPCQERLDEATEYVALMREAVRNVSLAPVQEPAWKRLFQLDWLPMPGPALAGAFVVLLAVLVWQPWRVTAPGEWQQVELATMRGDLAGPVAMEGFELDLRLDARGLALAGATAQIVAADGTVVGEFPALLEAEKAVVKYAPGLRAGQYWVRLRVAGETVREYSLAVRTRGV
jgi:anti-sigma factor RsiW